MAAGVGLACPVLGVGLVCPRPYAQITTSSPTCAGASALTSVPSACVTTELQMPFMGFDGKESHVLKTCRLSGLTYTGNALLAMPFCETTTSANGVPLPLGTGNGESSYGT